MNSYHSRRVYPYRRRVCSLGRKECVVAGVGSVGLCGDWAKRGRERENR